MRRLYDHAPYVIREKNKAYPTSEKKKLNREKTMNFMKGDDGTRETGYPFYWSRSSV